MKFLLNNSADEWDMDRVHEYFPEPMANLIQQIPISNFGREDFISWPQARLGIYTGRSAYNMAMTAKLFSKRCAKEHSDSFDLASKEKSWKAIWAVNSPNKDSAVANGP